MLCTDFTDRIELQIYTLQDQIPSDTSIVIITKTTNQLSWTHIRFLIGLTVWCHVGGKTEDLSSQPTEQFGKIPWKENSLILEVLTDCPFRDVEFSSGTYLFHTRDNLQLCWFLQM